MTLMYMKVNPNCVSVWVVVECLPRRLILLKNYCKTKLDYYIMYQITEIRYTKCTHPKVLEGY